MNGTEYSTLQGTVYSTAYRVHSTVNGYSIQYSLHSKVNGTTYNTVKRAYLIFKGKPIVQCTSPSAHPIYSR